ncbi:Rubis-subs-bind multi-domain protein [Pyrenophora tritici-repentis]|nr:Rubis-subs-bind multi-domain protein [Pyrenophora tritici-repentis]KAI0604095.1 Rubis-subs-bind multi-domain protein [Pyrenophora tritici-repentis]KAI0616326.1 Rubis-subs-bind multi-domain protein [Pyrenophora tritici-repentis]
MENWLKQSGASGLNSLELADFSDTGRGIRTLRRFEEGEKILTIPHGVLWTVKHAYADPLLGPALRSTRSPLSVDDTLATYILFVRSCGSGYDGLRSHVAALPASYTSSIFFAEAELEVCAGTSLYTTTKQLDRQIKDDYRGLVARLFGRHQELFPPDKFTIEDYKWALCTVWSRAMDFQLPDGDSIRLLAPFADMLNHSSEVKQCHAYDALSRNLSVLAGKNYESGDQCAYLEVFFQVFINYGPIPNNRLLRLYGFIVPGNPNDSYDLVLVTHTMAPFFEQKHKLWLSAGLDSISTISLTLTDPLPRSVLRYLRIQRLHESDLAIIAPHQSDAAVEKISDSNEVEVLQFLVESISSLLDGFGTQLEKLEEQLAEGFYSPGGNACGGFVGGGRERKRKWEGPVVGTGPMRELRKRFCAVDAVRKVQQGHVLRADVPGRPLQRAQGDVSGYSF